MRRYAGWAVVYAAVTAAMVSQLVNYTELHAASYPGDVRLIIWTLAWDNHAVLQRVPLFDANIYYPATRSLAYNEHLFGVSIFTLPIYAATLNPVLAYNIVWLLSFVLNGLGMHALLRRYTRSDLGAFAGALVFTFSYYKMLHAHGHLHLVWTWLLPVSLLLLHRWNDRPTMARVLTWGVTVLLQALTSWYLAVMVALVNGAATAALASRWREDWLRRCVHLGVAALVVAACLWPFAREYRYLLPAELSEVTANSADLAGYLIPPEHTWLGQLWLQRIGSGPRWLWGERTVYLGWTAVVIGLAGALGGLLARSRVAAFYLLMAVAAGALSFGPSASPDEGWRLFDLLRGVPGLGAFRAPARFAQIVLLGLSVLVAFGVAWLQRGWPRAAVVACIFLLPLMLSEWYVVGFPLGKPQRYETPEIYRNPALTGARALVSLPEYRATAQWALGSDYLFHSMTHWRPIVNGYGRTEPPEHFRVVSHMKAFPGPNNARTMRRLGIDFVVFHSDRFGPGADEIVNEAVRIGEYDLVAHIGGDYLFRVKPSPSLASTFTDRPSSLRASVRRSHRPSSTSSRR